MTVRSVTADGTATAPDDYTAVPPTTLTFSPGQTKKTVAVAVHGDTTAEGNENIVLKLSNPVGVVLGDAEGSATIVGEEGLPVVYVANSWVLEGTAGTTTLGFSITLSRPPR